MRIICWFFGCRPHPDDPAPIEYLECERCGEVMTYEALAGVTRWQAVKDWCEWWLLRRWIPQRCLECGKRYGEHRDCLPF